MPRAATTLAAVTPAQTARPPPSCCCRPSSASSTSLGCLSWYCSPSLLMNPLSLLHATWQPFSVLVTQLRGQG